MKELTNNIGALNPEVKKTEFSIITYLKNIAISHSRQIVYDGEIVMPVDGGYVLINADGQLTGHYYEEEGILPTLFKSPSGELWTSLISYHPDKEMEISIPFFDRAKIEMPKPNRPFVGDFVGATDIAAIFINIDIFSNSKPDKLLRVEFKNGLIKNKLNQKIELPKWNKVFISGSEIHLLAKQGKDVLHRKLDDNGMVVKQRTIFNCRQGEILTMSYTEASDILVHENETFSLSSVEVDGSVTTKEIVNVGSRIYSVWDAETLGGGCFLIRFTSEQANGWLVIKDKELVECFLGDGEGNYIETKTSKRIELANSDMILAGASKTKDDHYCLSFYPRSEPRIKPTELIMLNRRIGQ